VEAAGAERGDCGRRGVPDRVRHGEHGGQAPVDGGEERGLGRFREPRRLVGERGGVDAEFGHEAGGADLHPRAADRGADALSDQDLERLGAVGGGRAAGGGGRDQGARDRVLRRRFGGGDQGQDLLAREAGRDVEVRQLRAAAGEGAGLVQRDDARFAQRLQGVAAAEQHADRRAPAGADQDGNGRR
jgi:hypothetical protein